MRSVIELQCDKTVTILAGRKSGFAMYEQQVKGKVDFNEEIELIFPDSILRLASSFIQGFFQDFKDNMGIKGIEKKVIINSKHIDLERDIIRNLV